MEINIFNIKWWDWLLVILFLTIFIFLFIKGILGMISNLQTNNNQNAKRNVLRRNVFLLYCSGISLLIALGILIGLPIENLRCWLLFIPAQCFLLPWIAFNIWGLKIQMFSFENLQWLPTFEIWHQSTQVWLRCGKTLRHWYRNKLIAL